MCQTSFANLFQTGCARGIDESTKSTKRSFVEIEIGAQLRSSDLDLHIWCVPLTMKEAVSHSAEKMLELILDEFQ